MGGRRDGEIAGSPFSFGEDIRFQAMKALFEDGGAPINGVL